jgi:hypothetical protein
VQHIADFAQLQAAHEIEERGRIAAVEAQRQGDARRPAGGNSVFRGCPGQREGLFNEDMLAGSRGLDDLLVMLRVGGRQHHRLDARVGQNLLIARGEGDAGLFGEITARRRIA